MRVRLDEEALKNISNVTRGEYFYAGDAGDLKKVYEGLSARFSFEKKAIEVTAIFAAVAAVLTILAAALSVLWFHRIL
jgi:Ca-activated chloride channel family protein